MISESLNISITFIECFLIFPSRLSECYQAMKKEKTASTLLIKAHKIYFVPRFCTIDLLVTATFEVLVLGEGIEVYFH